VDWPQVTVRWGPVSHAVVLEQRIVIGRSADCHIQLDRVSVGREHLEICRKGTRVLAKDLFASGGSRVNGEMLSAGEHRRLRNGDVIAILASSGETVERLRMEILDPDESDTIAHRSVRFTKAQRETAQALVNTDPPRYRTIEEMGEILFLSERQVRARLQSLRVALKVADYLPSRTLRTAAVGVLVRNCPSTAFTTYRL
jgi:hypothetical protein